MAGYFGALQTPTHLFFSTFKVLEYTQSLDSVNSPVYDYPDPDEVATEYEGHLATELSTESYIASAERTTKMAKLYCSPDLEISQQDRIYSGGKIWRVIGIDIDTLGILQIINLEERK